MHVWLLRNIHIHYKHTYLFMWKYPWIHQSMSATCISTYIHTYIIHSYIHTYIHTHACLSAFIRIFMHTWIHAYLIWTYRQKLMFPYKHVGMHTYINNICRYSCMSVYIYTKISTCKYVCIHPCMSGYTHTYLCTYIHDINKYKYTYTFMNVCLHTSRSKCIQHTHMPAFIHTYIHTNIKVLKDVCTCTYICMHAYIHVYMESYICIWQTYRHILMFADKHAYIQVKHFSSERYINFRVTYLHNFNICMFSEFIVFQNYHTSGKMEIW